MPAQGRLARTSLAFGAMSFILQWPTSEVAEISSGAAEAAATCLKINSPEPVE